MHYRPLGNTGIQISALSFGAGPISTLMVGNDSPRQRQVVRQALDVGINWFDTAATYGQGQSEHNLGGVFRELGAASAVHVATKVRLTGKDLDDIRGAVRRSLAASLQRLQLPRVTLLQLHNSITRRRGDEPTSITPHDVLGPGGVAEAFEQLQGDGLVQHLGLTGIGHPAALREVVGSGRFATMQVPFHLLNPSAGHGVPEDYEETNYGEIIADCAAANMGVLAIRVLAGGALGRQSPQSAHVEDALLSVGIVSARSAARRPAARGPGPTAAAAARGGAVRAESSGRELGPDRLWRDVADRRCTGGAAIAGAPVSWAELQMTA